MFLKEAELIGASRRMNSLTLNRHTEILEILEIPQLMDTCVRNGYYEEALELAAYVRRLERKHAQLPVIQVSSPSRWAGLRRSGSRLQHKPVSSQSIMGRRPESLIRSASCLRESCVKCVSRLS